MATILDAAHTPGSSRMVERYNADMRLWMRLLMWATRNCAGMKA